MILFELKPKVKGRKNYEILKKINEALEIQMIFSKIQMKSVEKSENQVNPSDTRMDILKNKLIKMNSLTSENAKRKEPERETTTLER